MGSLAQQKRVEQRKRRNGYDKCLIVILIAVIYGSLLFPTRDVSNSASEKGFRRLSKHSRDPLDFSEYSCDDLYRHAMDKESQCAFASTCNDGDGIFAPIIYCSTSYSSRTLMMLLSAPLALLLIVLFRILGSTAEEFFSPGLEMFSIKLGLPERFAGVTLLALGNGAPDVASTVNAIRNDRKRGYLLALGELTGASMVASTVIVGVVAFVSSKPVPCRGAFVRDVIMFIITMVLVFSAFNDETIDPKEVRLFIGLYLAYVLIVLAADVYHRRNAAVREEEEEEGETSEEEKEPSETTTLLKGAAPSGKLRAQSIGTYELTQKKEEGEFWSFTSRPPHGSPTVMKRMIEALSNYDETAIPEEEEEDEDEEPTVDTELQQGPVNGHQFHSERDRPSGWGERDADGVEPLMVFHPHHGGIVDLKHLESAGVSDEEEGHSWLAVRQELTDYFKNFWDETYYNDEYNIIDKFLMTCELPFTVLRMFSIPVPCDGYYCRPLLALSIALSPFWLCYYFLDQFDVSIVEQPLAVIFAVFAVPLLIGLAVLRFAPHGDIPPRPSAAVAITLIGFVVSATWLDLIADKLVNLMTLFGIVCRIPSTIMGLTVLAWGNSSQDLIANMTVARKDLSTMAITASFAGPVFNMLVGLGIGFFILSSSEPGKTIHVHLDNPLRVGFLFSVLNGILMIVSGVCFGKGFIPKKYGYVALVVYFIYVVVSVTV